MARSNYFPLVISPADVVCFYCGGKPDIETLEVTGKPTGAYKMRCKCGWNTYFDLKKCPSCNAPALTHLLFMGEQNDGVVCQKCNSYFTDDLAPLGVVI